MSLFYRIINNQTIPVMEVSQLGWKTDGEYFLPPDEYFERGEFVIHRGCHSIGDWGIITALPRILKENYPGCKVYVTSEKFIENLYGPANSNPQNVWGIWANPYENVRNCFANNPYVDSFVDSFDGEIYHDHFRIKNHLLLNDPLVLQMARFHDIEMGLDSDYVPELYFSDEEVERFEKIRKQYFGDNEYGAFSIRHIQGMNMNGWIDGVEEKLSKYKDLPFMYYCNMDHEFKVNKVLSTEGMDVRLILYLVCHAKVATGMQTGLYDLCSRYTNVDIISAARHERDINEHYLSSIKYTFLQSE